jgi:hypothetical protein
MRGKEWYLECPERRREKEASRTERKKGRDRGCEGTLMLFFKEY